MLRVPCGLSVIVAILQRLCDAIEFAPVCCTYCASDSFLVSRNCGHSTVCRFFCFRALWTSQHSLQMWSHILQLLCNLPMLALHCCKYYPMAKLRAMNWCCIMPCNVRVLAAECCKYRASLRQILRSLEILTANDQHMVHRYFYTEVLSQRNVFTQIFTHTRAFTQGWFCTQIPSCTGVFTQGCFYTKNFCTQTRGYLYTQMPLHGDAFTEECFYTHVRLHRASFDTN